MTLSRPVQFVRSNTFFTKAAAQVLYPAHTSIVRTNCARFCEMSESHQNVSCKCVEIAASVCVRNLRIPVIKNDIRQP